MSSDQHLLERLSAQAKRRHRALQDSDSLLAQTVFAGTLGILLALPIVAGAYLGNWLDGLASGYSVRWTLSFILLGVVVGAVNVWLFIREH